MEGSCETGGITKAGVLIHGTPTPLPPAIEALSLCRDPCPVTLEPLGAHLTQQNEIWGLPMPAVTGMLSYSRTYARKRVTENLHPPDLLSGGWMSWGR